MILALGRLRLSENDILSESIMQTYDLFMLLVLGAAALFGFWKGLAWQVASVASLVLSYVAALRFSAQLAPRFGDSAPWNKFVAMLVIYVAVSAAIWLAFRLISGFIDRVKLNEFDHQLGLVLGLAKGVLWCVAITFFAVTLLPTAQKEKIIASRAGRYIVVLLDKTEAVVPPEIHDVIQPYILRIEQGLDPNAPQPALPWQNLQQQSPFQSQQPPAQNQPVNWQGGPTRQSGAAPPAGYPQPAPNWNQQQGTQPGQYEPRPFPTPQTANQPAPQYSY
jgi:membrane protein required for colicin V production